MNSLGIKKDDINRQPINKLASMASARLLLVNRRLRAETPEWSQWMIRGRQSLNHSWAKVKRLTSGIKTVNKIISPLPL
jgi:hypothetical protein